jgi:hypothetical protein
VLPRLAKVLHPASKNVAHSSAANLAKELVNIDIT